jgi:hypothetical protein
MSDTLQPAPDLEPLPPLPPNACVLAVRPGPDKAHTLLRLNFNVTHLSDDAQKLLCFALAEALGKLEEGIKAMNRIEVAAKLAQRERIQNAKGNGTP